MPAYNESDRIGFTLDALNHIPDIEEIIVVDDGSHDNTAEIARSKGALVLLLQKNRGKGEAVWHGVRKASNPLLVLVDADLGESAIEVRYLLEPLLQQRAEMSVAVFPTYKNKKKGGMGLVKQLSRWGILLLAQKNFSEPLSGQRALIADIFEEMEKPPRGFGLEVALTLKALLLGYRVLEIPVMMSHRERGRDLNSILHRGKQFKAVCNALWLGLRERVLAQI